MASGKGEIKGWVTRHGVHIPIYDNYSVRGGVEPKAKSSRFKKKKRPEAFDKDIRETELDSGKKVYFAAHSSEQGKKQGVKDLDKSFDTKEEARAFLAKENGDTEDAFPKKEQTNSDDKAAVVDKYMKDNPWAAKMADDQFKSGRKYQDIQNDMYEAAKSNGKKEVDKDDNKPKNFKEGLKQHEGIQKIANDQNEKVWNGGATNQELYDAADKFAESKNFNKDKVRDAAFSAFNEKWVATQKERASAKVEQTSPAPLRAEKEIAKRQKSKVQTQPNKEVTESVKGNATAARGEVIGQHLLDNTTPEQEAQIKKNGWLGENGRLKRTEKSMKVGAAPTTVSGLRNAYSEATGSMKSQIAAELRRKGYNLVGGKWVKGK